jgi:hypothetical protein
MIVPRTGTPGSARFVSAVEGSLEPVLGGGPKIDRIAVASQQERVLGHGLFLEPDFRCRRLSVG